MFLKALTPQGLAWLLIALFLWTCVFSIHIEALAANCPYAKSKLGAEARCEKFGDTNVLRFDTTGAARAHIVCVHGLGLCAKAYIPFAERMSSDGYRTCSIDVRGFGAGRDKEGDKLDLGDSIAEIKELLEYIRKHEPGTPTYLIGESMGGAIAIAVASKYPDLVDGIICSAPAWKVYKRKRTAAKSIFDLVMTAPGPAANSLMKQATSDARLRAHWRKDHDHTLDLSAGEIISFMRFIAKTPERAETIKVPVLLIHGLKDRLIKPEGTARLFKKIKSSKKCLLMFDSGEHLILEEGQFDDTVISAVKRWISDCSCPVPSEKHTNAVVIVKTRKLKQDQFKRVNKIFRLAGVNRYKMERYDLGGKNRELMVVDFNKDDAFEVEPVPGNPALKESGLMNLSDSTEP